MQEWDKPFLLGGKKSRFACARVVMALMENTSGKVFTSTSDCESVYGTSVTCKTSITLPLVISFSIIKSIPLTGKEGRTATSKHPDAKSDVTHTRCRGTVTKPISTPCIIALVLHAESPQKYKTSDNIKD